MRMLGLSFIIFSILLLTSCEYDEYYKIQQTQRNPISVENLGINVPTLTGITVWTLPDKEKLRELNTKLSHAEHRIWIEIYSWTEKSTLETVIAAKKRGVDVRVLLEGNVYGAPEINRPAYERLLDVGIPVKYTSNDNFTFTHAKFWLIDNSYFVSTGNLSVSAFTKNRELILSGKHPDILANLEHIFLSDTLFHPYIDERISPLVISPQSIRVGLENTLLHAKKSIYLYIQSLSDKTLIELLKKKAKEGLRVTICLADKGEEDTSTLDTMEALSIPNISIKKIKKPYPHIKYLNIDEKTWFIGSANFTQNALDNNREVGLIFQPETFLYEDVQNVLEKECPVIEN